MSGRKRGPMGSAPTVPVHISLLLEIPRRMQMGNSDTSVYLNENI